MAAKRTQSRIWALALGLAAVSPGAMAQAPPQVTVVTENQIDTIPVSEFGGAPMAPLEALARLVGAELRPGSEQGAILSAHGTVARIAEGRNFVTVERELVLLTSPPRQVTGHWFVPLDFIPKVLPAFSRDSLTYRDSERMLLVGDSFPTLEVRSTRDPAYTRVEVSTSRAVPIEVSQTDKEIRLAIQAPYLNTGFQSEEILDEVVERIALRRKDKGYELTVTLGKQFWTLQATTRESPDPTVVLNLLRSRLPVRARGEAAPGQVETIHEDLRSIEERASEEAARSEAEQGAEAVNVDEIVLGSDPAAPSAADILSRNTGPTRLRIVAIDPGHGGTEAGAEGKGGLIEKDLVLSIARDLRELLSERLGLQVILTRDGDGELDLDERTALANNNKADLFVSIHADASPSRDAAGSSVYFLSYSSSGVEGTVESARGRPAANGGNLDFILWDMAQASHLTQSSRLAEIMQEELLSATGAEKGNRGIKQNTFRVLKGATMPAVLVEVGFISNPREEELLKTRDYQESIAEALFRGVQRFKDIYEVQPRAESDREGRLGPK
jgi:N-acetylmuramoyl-L-alanine amidase